MQKGLISIQFQGSEPLSIIVAILQFQIQRCMLRTSIYSKQAKIEHKKQRSQEPRGMRNRKNNSPSPVYKEINMNKQNMHPNRPNLNLYLDQEQYRQAYYQMKQQSLQSRLDIQKQSQPVTQLTTCVRNSRAPRQIEIKLTNKSLEKCQIHPPFEPSPKAQYLLNYQQGPNHVDVLSCDSCSWGFSNNAKVNLDRVTNTTIGNGLTIKQYYSILLKKIEQLQKAQHNTESWEKSWRLMSVQQGTKLRKYYNDILQIIEVSMRAAENRLASHLNQGQKILAGKREEIQEELERTKIQLKKLLTFQQKQLTFQFGSYLKQISFDIESSKRKFQLEIKLPIIHIYTQIPNLKLEFQKIFQTSFSLEPLTNAQLQLRCQERQKQIIKSLKCNSGNLSPYSSHHSYNKTSTRQEDEADLFCEESLGQSKNNKTNEFSFEKSNQSSILLGKNTDCILELVEEEDVISPVFKAI